MAPPLALSRRSRPHGLAATLVCLAAGLVAPQILVQPALAQSAIGATPPAAAIVFPPPLIRLEVDATDTERRIISVRQTFPVAPGALTVHYPKYLPGNHTATGPIQLLAGLTLRAGDAPVEWVRDGADPYAFHLTVPEGATELVAEFQWLTQSDNAVWRVVMTPAMVNLQWEKALLYPGGRAAAATPIQASVRLPSGWGIGGALKPVKVEADGGAEVTTFEPTDLYTLVDSPLFAGAHFRRIDIDTTARDAIHLNIVADKPAGLAATPAQIALYENLVVQADRLFGVRHFDRYDFLVAASDQLGGIGLEHHRSSENSVAPDFFTNWSRSTGARDLLPHEFSHSWNGKFRRPFDELTDNYDVQTRNSLLWVYEGQTEYWGDVLAARAGLHSTEEALIRLAGIAAFYDNQPGRAWRSLQDTTTHNQLGYRVPGQWTSWMRGSGDYYREALLVWLDADTLIRELSGDRRSLDNFARAFFGGREGDMRPKPYTFDDVVAALNAVQPHDWATFLRARLDAVGPEAKAPLDGLARGGYRLVYTDALTAAEKAVQTGWATDFQYSLGFTLTGATNRLSNIRWGGPAFEAGLGAGWDLMAVNDVAATPEVLREAITAAKGGEAPITLLLKSGARYRTVALAYSDGLRYPRLERIEGTPDRLTQILTPRRR